MRQIPVAVMLAGALVSITAFAQDTRTNNSPNPPAVSTGDENSKTSAAPVAGKNSFSEAQAKNRLDARGYTDVKGLNKDDQGIWHGSAMKGGKSVNVTLDYQGNIAEQ
jgi:hypothetical protein